LAPPARVLYLNSSSGRYGADRQLVALAAGLDPARYVPLTLLPSEGELADDLRAAGVEVEIRPLAVLRRALFSPRGLVGVAVRAGADAAGLRRLIRARRVEVVHSNTSVILSGLAGARAAGVPHVFSVREIYTDFARFWPYYRRVLMTSAALSCSSEATRIQFGDSARARVIHEAVTLAGRAPREEARRQLGLADDAFVCAVLGRISSWKGQELLARALAEWPLSESGAIGLVAGAAWPGQEGYEEDLRALARSLGLDDRLRMLGFREPELVYGAADVVVVPSTRPDPLPNAALESTASGCCVVAAAHGGLPEIIRDGQTGRLFAPGDHVALAGVLAELMADPAQRARLGAAAAADVPERFSEARLLEATQALYDEVRGVRRGS
jgi:glycosyltransferase involved in cell wall biosynthesis